MKTLTTTLMATLILVSTGCEFKEYNDTKEFSDVITHVNADADSATIVVKPSDTEVITVEADLEYWGGEPDFDAWIDGSTLKVDLDCHPSCDGEIVVLVPADASVDAQTGSGNVGIRDMNGDITASTGSANVTITNALGNLNLDTGSGNIKGSGLSAENCYADTGSGNVVLSFDEAPYDVDMETGSGNIRLSVPYGSYDVDLETGSGNTSIDGLIDDPDSPNIIRGDTGSGNISVQGF